MIQGHNWTIAKLLKKRKMSPHSQEEKIINLEFVYYGKVLKSTLEKIVYIFCVYY